MEKKRDQGSTFTDRRTIAFGFWDKFHEVITIRSFFGFKREFYSAEYWLFLCSIKASPNRNTTHPRSDNFISFHETVGILQSKLFSILGRIFIFLLSPGHTPQKKTNSPCLKCAIITCLRFNLAFMAWGVHQVSSIFYEQCLWTYAKVQQIANQQKYKRIEMV